MGRDEVIMGAVTKEEKQERLPVVVPQTDQLNPHSSSL